MVFVKFIYLKTESLNVMLLHADTETE